MRKFYFVFAVIISAIFASCEKSVVDQTKDEFITVNFALSANGVSLTSETPLTKGAEPNAIYGIKVLEYVDYGKSTETIEYCYGLFDDVSSLSITFRKGYHYDFTIQYFPNGKNEIVMKNSTEYDVPFCRFPHISHNSRIVFNQINYDSEDTLYLLGDAYCEPREQYVYKNWNFEPKENEVEKIELERANAGLTFVLQKVDGFDYDTVIVDALWVKYNVKVSEKNKVTIPLIAMNTSHTYGVNGVNETCEIWISVGTEENDELFFHGKVEAKNNTMRTYTILLKPQDTTTNPIDITCKRQSMPEENQGTLN